MTSNPEELAYDYNFILPVRHSPATKKRYSCRCGAAQCRGTMLARKRPWPNQPVAGQPAVIQDGSAACIRNWIPRGPRLAILLQKRPHSVFSIRRMSRTDYLLKR